MFNFTDHSIMKKFTSILLKISAVALLTACGGGTPLSVTETFVKMFPDAKDVEWTHEDDNTWEAEFEVESKEFSASFSEDGTWIETELEVEIDDIPYEAMETIDSTYADMEVLEASWLETADFIGYELELGLRGEEEAALEVRITADGRIINEDAEVEVKAEGDD